MSNIAVIDNDFQKEVLEAKELVLVDFWASWCYPCTILGPVIEEIANEDKSIKVLKMDVDSNPLTAQKYNIMSIPTVILFKDGKIVNQFIGVQPKDNYLNAIKEAK